jgi:exodeoxyribonuclease VII large subunit
MTPPKKPLDFETHGSSPELSQSQASKIIYTVSELTAKIKSVLETGFSLIWICGEVSNLRVPPSGHFYFTLKDENAQISAVVFRGQYRQARIDLEDGMRIVGLGRLSVYEPRGNYQVILEYLEPAGLGALQQAFEKLKKRLAAEGYFDQRHKKTIPFIPNKISVITSPSGAVVHDIITVLDRRFRNLRIEIVPVSVQGPRAEEEISAAIALVNQRADSDVIILARGGGSLEDLQAFNSETVAMAIFNSGIPLISAVGHETDVTIADFVADLRAPTPSAAAELVVPEKDSLLRHMDSLDKALHRNFTKHIDKLNLNIKQLNIRLKDPRKKIQEIFLKLDDLGSRLCRLLPLRIQHTSDRLQWLVHRLDAVSPIEQVQKYNSKLDVIIDNLFKTLVKIISIKLAVIREHTIKLNALNPLAILDRGYSITRTLIEKRVVTHPDQVSLHDDIEVLLAGGTLLCNIQGKSTDGEENV